VPTDCLWGDDVVVLREVFVKEVMPLIERRVLVV
jgi:hypothetical protein